MNFFNNNFNGNSSGNLELKQPAFVSNVMSSQDFKIGQYVRIGYVKDSPYNIYKGYIAEIKQYKHGLTFAIVTFHAICHYNRVRIPIEHFHKI